MKFYLLIFIVIPAFIFGQHTFSIVAIDPITNEIGSAGATCLDNVILNGEEGALVVSDIILGKGAIHTQAYWTPVNQIAARQRMEAGDSPQQIIEWLEANDNSSQGGNISDRQYGIVGFTNNGVEATAFTGSGNFDFAGHKVGENYAIQGNILLNEAILNGMEDAFVNTIGSLGDKLMAAMQAAKVPGADQRCLSDGVSSLSAFLRIAQPTDQNSDYGNLSVDINIGATPDGIDPIDELQTAYNNTITSVKNNHLTTPNIQVFPNPNNTSFVNILLLDDKVSKVRIIDLEGRLVQSVENQAISNNVVIDVSDLQKKIYLIEMLSKKGVYHIEKLIILKD